MVDDLESIAKQRVQARNGLYVHAMMYLAMNAGFVAIWAITGHGYPWFVWPMLGWGIGMLAHIVTFIIGPGSPHERRAIDRELHRLREQPN